MFRSVLPAGIPILNRGRLGGVGNRAEPAIRVGPPSATHGACMQACGTTSS